MADNHIHWSTYSGHAHLFAGATLKDLGESGTGISALSGEVDGTAGDQYGDFVLLWDPVATPAAGGYISVWLVQAVDGTNYDTLLGATLIPQRPADIIFPIGAEAAAAHAAQRVTIGPVLLPPCKWKAILQNNTSQHSVNTDDLSTLDVYLYSDNMVSA
jgi:hypothetical protein